MTVAIPAIALRALEFVAEGDVVGLGTGAAATAFIRVLGERIQMGQHVRGVPTSEASARLAADLGIPLATLDEIETIDVTIDGADEVDPELNLIKGLGGALVREKVVAAASKRLIVLVGPENVEKKLSPTLGVRGVLPVEVVPFALSFCRRRLKDLGLPSSPRQAGGRLFVSDNGNVILDCQTAPIPDPIRLEKALHRIPGIVGTGLFLGMAHTVLVQDGETITVRQRKENT